MADNQAKPSQDEIRLRETVDFYDNQTEDEEVAELEAAWTDPNAPMIQVPRELVPAVRSLIAHYNRLHGEISVPSAS